MMLVEILYFDSCPGWRAALERVREVIADSGMQDAVTLRMVPVETAEDASRQRFVGSPTVRVDGRDVDPAAASLTFYALQCRLYENYGRLEALPPSRWIREAMGVSAQANADGRSPLPACTCAGPAVDAGPSIATPRVG